MQSPVAEVEVTETMVRSLLIEQHPDLAGMPLRELDAGWDNTLWRLGDELLVRLPRRLVAAPLTVNEQRWLPELAPRLPLPVPAPVRIGQPSGAYPWRWSVVPWFPGVPGDLALITDADDAARRLGRFLRALHQPVPPGAPRNPVRGGPLRERVPAFHDRRAELTAMKRAGTETEVDLEVIQAVWDRALGAAPWAGPPLWLHGDLHPANVLIAGGTLAAVIDFGDMCGGDPATDVAAAWMLLPTSSMAAFAGAYGQMDDALGWRALGWATHFGLMLLAVGHDNRPSYRTVGRATLRRVGGYADPGDRLSW
jgi:aminoglycoside phosphotransferase (APT) family kinase protein